MTNAFRNNDSYSAHALSSIDPDLCEHLGVEGGEFELFVGFVVFGCCASSVETPQRRCGMVQAVRELMSAYILLAKPIMET